jgi:hypothetical protein
MCTTPSTPLTPFHLLSNIMLYYIRHVQSQMSTSFTHYLKPLKVGIQIPHLHYSPPGKPVSVITDLMLPSLLSSKFHLILSVTRLRKDQLAQYPGLPSAIIVLAILSLYHYLVPYVMYFCYETNMKYVSYRLREINDFDLIFD